jgi:hypothetical protein
MRSTAYDLALWESTWHDFGVGLPNRTNSQPPPDYRPFFITRWDGNQLSPAPTPRIVHFGNDSRNLRE